ncbi:translation initiation factor IF-3, partial [Candidatus Parcubacteria bacterium]
MLSLEEARRLAEEKGLDLIEIAPQADPPVARVMNFDKYRYLQEKAEKKKRIAQKAAGLKHIRISARAARNDLLTRLKKLEEFLEAGHQIEVIM